MDKLKPGRPKGLTGKYKDSLGNPIGVYEWRKLNRGRLDKHKHLSQKESTGSEKLDAMPETLNVVAPESGKVSLNQEANNDRKFPLHSSDNVLKRLFTRRLQ
jgi:hypothetical protein